MAVISRVTAIPETLLIFRPWSRAGLCWPLLLLAIVAACRSQTPTAAAPPPVPVEVTQVVKRSLPVILSAIGRVEAYATVQVKSQVDGEIARVHFREGDEVRRGQILFTIDPRPYEAQLQQALANLARDRALLENARKDAARYAALSRQDLVSAGEYEQYATRAASLEATVRADQAAVESARLKLEYCTIRAPMDGKTGDLLLHQGNLVKANDDKSVLVVIRQLEPIYVSFVLPERYLPEIKVQQARRRLPVVVKLPPENRLQVRGELDFIDNKVDEATGTIQLKALFANQDRWLWPGQFVNVDLLLAEQPEAVAVPARAVQSGQEGSYVFVVTPAEQAEVRRVVVDRTLDDLAVIQSGLQAGELVVTEGQLRLFPGARVVVKNSPESAG